MPPYLVVILSNCVRIHKAYLSERNSYLGGKNGSLIDHSMASKSH